MKNRKINISLFYIILYFTANWLPDASNKQLNKKLENFYTSKNSKKKSNKIKYNFELIFISSDKTKNSYDQFLNSNKYIRYALSFQDQELKVILFNILVKNIFVQRIRLSAFLSTFAYIVS